MLECVFGGRKGQQPAAEGGAVYGGHAHVGLRYNKKWVVTQRVNVLGQLASAWHSTFETLKH